MSFENSLTITSTSDWECNHETSEYLQAVKHPGNEDSSDAYSLHNL